MHSLDQLATARCEYSLTTSRKIDQSVFAGVFFVGAVFFLKLAVDPIGRDFVVAVGGTSLILGLIVIAQTWTSRLTLDGDRIEVRSVFRTRSATLAEIEGFRKIQNQYGRWTRIYLKQDLGNFNVSESFAGNTSLQHWLKRLPDLDRRDADEIANQVGLQESLGQERIGAPRAFRPAKARATGLSVLAGAASIPVMFVSYAPIIEPRLLCCSLVLSRR